MYIYVCKQVDTCPCLLDRTNGRSPVREKHTYTHTSLPTRPHKWQIAGQRETHVYTHTSLPTRPHKWQIAGQGETHVYTHTSLPTRPHKWQIAGQGETHVHTHTSLPTRCHRQLIASQGEIHIHAHVPYRAPGTVEVHFLFYRSSGSGRLDTTTILSTCLKQAELSLTRACSNDQKLLIMIFCVQEDNFVHMYSNQRKV